MLFDKKLKRVIDVEKSEKDFEESIEKEKLEKGDKLAMIIAALIVFVPAFIAVIGIFALAIWFFFGRFM